jgi:muramoyltetrapeptide carboxypeptidase
VIAARGGYGSTYLLDGLEPSLPVTAKIVMGHSDLTCLQVYLWQKRGWVTFYGPMLAAGFDKGAEAAGGYDSNSFQSALTQSERGWALDLGGEAMAAGDAEGVLLGGCLTLIRSTIGTPWELDTRGAILLLEDRALKPYQLDRALMHLKQAGKFSGVKGIILGEFPEWGPGDKQEVTPRAVADRVLGALGIPVVWGAAVGHTPRPMLTLPLGIRCRLRATGSGLLEFLEPAVTSPKSRAMPRQKEGGQA